MRGHPATAPRCPRHSAECRPVSGRRWRARRCTTRFATSNVASSLLAVKMNKGRRDDATTSSPRQCWKRRCCPQTRRIRWPEPTTDNDLRRKSRDISALLSGGQGCTGRAGARPLLHDVGPVNGVPSPDGTFISGGTHDAPQADTATAAHAHQRPDRRSGPMRPVTCYRWRVWRPASVQFGNTNRRRKRSDSLKADSIHPSHVFVWRDSGLGPIQSVWCPNC